MDSKQLTKIMLGDAITAIKFKGVYPADGFLDMPPTYPTSYIINTDPRDQPGKHWVAIYMTSDSNCEFFNSYGKPPQHYHNAWLSWIKYYSYKWTYNHHCVQPAFTATCGLHCLFYLYHRCQGIVLKTIQKLYSTQLPLNDKIAEEDLEAHILQDIIIDDSDFIVNQLCNSLL